MWLTLRSRDANRLPGIEAPCDMIGEPGLYKSFKRLQRETKLAEKALRDARAALIEKFARQRGFKILTALGWCPVVEGDPIDAFEPKSIRGWCNQIDLIHTRATWAQCRALALDEAARTLSKCVVGSGAARACARCFLYRRGSC